MMPCPRLHHTVKGKETAAVWATIAQVHSTLALAAATTANTERQQQASHAVVWPSTSDSADLTAVVENEWTRWMRAREEENIPDSDGEPEGGPAELPNPFGPDIFTYPIRRTNGHVR